VDDYAVSLHATLDSFKIIIEIFFTARGNLMVLGKALTFFLKLLYEKEMEASLYPGLYNFSPF